MHTLVSKLNRICPECGGSLAWETKWNAEGTEFSVTRCCGHTHIVRNRDSNFGKGRRGKQLPPQSQRDQHMGWGLLIFAMVQLILDVISMPPR